MNTKRVTIKQVKDELDILREAFGRFVSNDFKHLNDDIQGCKKRLDTLYTVLFGALVSTCLTLIGLIINLVLTITKG